MRVGQAWRRTIELAADGWAVEVIDQTALPARLTTVRLATVADAARAIVTMTVRGAPLIGVTAAYGMAFAMRADPDDDSLHAAATSLVATRPTAVNLHWAVDRMRSRLVSLPPGERERAAYAEAATMAEEDVDVCRAIARHGVPLLEQRWRDRGARGVLNVLTHCNAGWLAAVDWGTALAPVYQAHENGLPVHVWVDETRPRNQGLLTAWELGAHGVPFTVIADNAGGHLMQRGQVDLCLVGTDRTTRNGDVANKIGTYLKALAAFDSGVPFYVAAPSSSIDFGMARGDLIPIEERSAAEFGYDGDVPVANPAFDVTPARLITGLVTERGLTEASPAGLVRLFPERCS